MVAAWSGSAFGWAWMNAVLGLIFGYGGTAVFCLPVFMLPRPPPGGYLWVAVVLGCFGGAVTYLAMAATINLIIDEDGIWDTAGLILHHQPRILLSAGVLGAIVVRRFG